MNPHQIEELAMGLERSQHNFLWVIRPPKGHNDIKPLFPAGFLERTRGRGLVVDWCIQLDVLSHPSVSVFLSHCGWNSTLDALSLGIPMLAFGIWADQPTNAKFVADVWKTGMRMRKGEDGIVGRDEIERCVRLAMEGQEFAEARKKSGKWKEVARRAMIEGGSSDANLDQFAREISANIPVSKFISEILESSLHK
uniref:UDP-glycosyltransferases domain-containing protein n=1 Tax=Araucaria cunninghamii TaxID=56994 RepID=A0A0D6R124_ARACU